MTVFMIPKGLAAAPPVKRPMKDPVLKMVS